MNADNKWRIFSTVLVLSLFSITQIQDFSQENNSDFINSELDPLSLTDSATAIKGLVDSESGVDTWTFVETTNVVKSGSDPASFTDSVTTIRTINIAASETVTGTDSAHI